MAFVAQQGDWDQVGFFLDMVISGPTSQISRGSDMTDIIYLHSPSDICYLTSPTCIHHRPPSEGRSGSRRRRSPGHLFKKSVTDEV